MSISQEQRQALAEIADLVHRHELSASQVANYLSDTSPSSSGLLTKVISYIGGSLLIAGMMAFIALQWDSLNSAARILVTLGSGSVTFLLSLIARQDARYHTVSVPLLLVSALLQPTGMLVTFAELSQGGDERIAAFLTALTFGVQFGAYFWRWGTGVAAWLTIFFCSAAWGFALDLLGFDWSLSALTLGSAWLSLGVATRSGPYPSLSGQLFLIGCWSLLAGLFEMIEASVFEVLFIAACCGLIYLGVWARSRMLNFASTVGLLTYTAYFTGQHFADSIGWPIALMLIGLLMIGISALALKIDRRYLSARAE